MIKRKRIALLGPCYPYRGGNALFMGHLFDKLSMDFDVEMINYSLLYPSLLFPGTTQFDKSTETIKPIPSKRLINSIQPFSWIKTANYLKKNDFDLVVFDWYNPFFGPALGSIASLIQSKYHGKRLFITENVISHEARLPDRLLTNYGLANADHFLTLSDKVIDQLKPWSKNKKVFKSELPVYDCYDMGTEVDHKAFISETGFDPSNHKIILFFGYIRKYKGLDLLIDAMPSVIKQLPDARLVIVGESYDDITIYTDQIKRLGLEDKICLVNRFVPNEEVGKYFEASVVSVLPYRSATQSGILNIAYGFGKPVIITPVGGLQEFVDERKTGLVLRSADANAIADGIIDFFTDNEQIPYRTYIESKVKANGFEKINEVFSEILNLETKH
jgi:glycosyltransferase involved in cell wall biosynthesis